MKFLQQTKPPRPHRIVIINNIMRSQKILTGSERWEWMGMGVAGIIINNYEMDHSLIPDLKHQ